MGALTSDKALAKVARVVGLLRRDPELETSALLERGFTHHQIEEARRQTGIPCPKPLGPRSLAARLSDAAPETYVCRRPHPWKPHPRKR